MMDSVYMLTLRQLTGRWRIIVMTVLAAMPVVITLLVLSGSSAPPVDEFEEVVFSNMLAGAIIPMVVLAIASAGFGNEVEDRTLANLTLAALPRWRIALPKLLAAITLAAPFIGISAFLTSHFAYLGDARATAAGTLAAIAGVALYASAFTFLGLVSSQAIGAGLVYIVLWEGFFSNFVGGVRMLSIRHYAMGLMHAIDPRRLDIDNTLAPAAAITASIVVFFGFLWLTVRRLRRMDVP